MAASTSEELRGEYHTDEEMPSDEEAGFKYKSDISGMDASTIEELRIEFELRTDEGMPFYEEDWIEYESDIDQEMTSDEEVSARIELIRDQELSDALVEEELDRWERFLELSPEEALLSTKGMQKVLDIANADSHYFILNEDVFGRLSDIEDGTALLLAVLGRGVSLCSELNLHIVFGRKLVAKEVIALCANLKSNANIKKLTTRQNVFGTPQMCAVLSDALTTNNTLTELCIRNVEMSPVALRCLLFGGRRSRSSWHPTKIETELATIQVRRKSSNDYVELSKLQKELKMEVEKLVGGGLLANATVQTLDIEMNRLFDTTCLAVFLSKNPTLKTLRASNTGLDFLSAQGMADVLKVNTNLQELYLTENKLGYDGVELILESLSQTNNSTLKKLEIGGMGDWSVESFAIAHLVLMLETNTSLVHLRIIKMPFQAKHWMQQILPALSKNKSLEVLVLENCRGLSTDEVHQAFLKVVAENTIGLRRIELKDTDMRSWEGRLNEELRKNVGYRNKLREQVMVSSTSGRLVLCGYEFAGKTTICKTLEQILRQGTPLMDRLRMAWKRFTRTVPCLQEILFGVDAPRELADRTRGVDIVVLDRNPLRISVWDFAGQREYYALHDYLFPDVQNSYFVYVCSCRCSPFDQNSPGGIKSKAKMKEEFRFWMRFIASNSKVTPRTSGLGRGPHLPYVHFVLTNKDTLPRAQGDLSEQWAQSVVNEAKKDFRGVIEIRDQVSGVNAHSPADVEKLIQATEEKLKDLLRSSTEYAICKEVRQALDDWSVETANPIMSLSEFQRFFEDDIPVRPGARDAHRDAKLYDEETQKAILAYLNNMGDIIHPKGVDFIVVNRKWFGVGILGQLIDIVGGAGDTNNQSTATRWNGLFGHSSPRWAVDHENGFVSKENIMGLLEHSLTSLEMPDGDREERLRQLMQLMMALEMCFEGDPGNKDSPLFVPALFDDVTESAAKGERKLMWSLDNGTIYLGRRLQCLDTITTFLTPGFFPRLQVHLVNYLRNGPLQIDSSRMKVERNLIEFLENGQQVFVEYSGDIDYFIDILVKSSKSHNESLQFIKDHVVKEIVDFCAKPQGCPGVLLEEAVIRPICVEDLLVCACRKGHSELVVTLENNIKAKGKGYVHHWQRIGNESCTDYALVLLEGEESYGNASSSSTTFGSGRGGDQHKSSPGDQLPKYYLSITDVGLLGKLKASVKGLMPFKLHLYCDIKEGSSHCKVEGQSGRDMKLDYAGHCSDLSLLKPVVKFLWDKVGAGFNIDNLINCVFDGSSMVDIDRKTLHKLINTGKTLAPVSDDVIVKALADFIAHTPGRLKKMLEVDVEPKFSQDFGLRRVEYSQPTGKIAWLCPKHYKSAFMQKLLKAYTSE